MIYINNLKEELNRLFGSLESDEVLLILKEEFIDRLVNMYEFDDIYSESKKNEYFIKLENYIKTIKRGLYKQRILSNLELNEMYKIYDYYEYNNILNILNWSIDYIKSNYTEIDLLKKYIIRHEIPDNIINDLEKIDKFLILNK